MRGVTLLRRLAFASLVANVGIVVTGGAVRLTASGLGCPTWPRCTDESYRTTPEMGVHGVIEFGNRLLTFVLVAVAIAGLVVAWRQRPRRRELVLLAGAVFLIIPVQGLIGGLTVLTDLNPWVVGLHFLASIGVITAAWAFWRRTVDPAGPTRPVVSRPVRQLVGVATAASLAVIAVGVVVTGSGPHAGDAAVPRNGLDPVVLTNVHSAAVFVAVAGTVVCALWLRSRAALLLLAVEGVQAGIGISQYYLGLPIGLVLLHLLGAALAIAAGTNLMLSVRGPRRSVEPAAAGQAVGAERVPLRG
jgi:cytochrome c oxidase assembly protein subunit 15